VRLLIDSHVALWWLAADSSMGPGALASISSADEVYFSPVTPWELGIKRSLGKLEIPDGLITTLVGSGMVELPISAHHAERAASLPGHHRDPFDRMLVAQAQAARLALVSADPALLDYDVEVIDARA
jgi:PIN domain nuclease of toxin-antitoxin system